MRPQHLLATLLIPLSQANEWQAVEFKNIPANKVTFAQDGLQMRVESSASPLVHKLSKVVRAKSVTAKYHIEGALKNPEDKFPDDAFLRVGLVVPGQRRLSLVEKTFAANWVLRLFELCPKDQGLSHIEFFDVVESQLRNFKPRERVVPKSKDLMRETIVATDKDESFHFKLPSPLNVAAIWLGADGDESKAKFSVWVKEIALEDAAD